MPDLVFLLQFAGSIIVVGLPIAVILWLLAANGADGITSLFMVRHWDDRGSRPADEPTPPAWHPELLTPRRGQRTAAGYPADQPSGGMLWLIRKTLSGS